jgi:hypothetical protein
MIATRYLDFFTNIEFNYMYDIKIMNQFNVIVDNMNGNIDDEFIINILILFLNKLNIKTVRMYDKWYSIVDILKYRNYANILELPIKKHPKFIGIVEFFNILKEIPKLY